MAGGRSVCCFIVCIVLFFTSLGHVISDEESQVIISHSKVTEHDIFYSVYSGEHPSSQLVVDMAAHINRFSNLIVTNEVLQEEFEEKSSYVIMTNVNFAKRIYINENQIIGIWSQNISSETRILYHKISGKYPDGGSFWGESDHIEIQPGKSLLTYFTVYNTGRGIGFFDFTCEVWEDISSWPDTKHDWKSDYYLATFSRPSGVSNNYYCDDNWHHPSDYEIYEKAFHEAGGSTTPREAVIALMNFVHNYLYYDFNYGQRTSDLILLDQRRGDCNDFADLYVGLARAVNIPTRIVLGTLFHYDGGEEGDIFGAYCYPVRYEGHAWAESYYNGAFHHVDPTWNVIEYPRVYINSSSDVHSIHASAYTACSDNYESGNVWVRDAECCLDGFYDVTTITDGGYDTKHYCPSDIDTDGICDNFDPDKDGDGIPNQSDPFPCTELGVRLADIPSLFPSGSFHVVGDAAYCTDVLGTANLSWIFGFNSMERPEGRTDRILPYAEHYTGNLLITGGPAVNPLAVEFGQYFGITYRFEDGNFVISCETQEIALPLSQYPHRDIAIIYLGREGERTILITWGYGWQGTYAATVFLSHPFVWGVYGEEHLLFVEWVDSNYNGLISWDEITVAYPNHVPLSPAPPGSWWLDSPVFRYIASLFGGNSFHVVGDAAYCTDVLGTANVSWLFGSDYSYMERPEGRTDVILSYTEHQTGNLLITGGPAVNPLAEEFGQFNYFNISYVLQQGDYFEISSDGCRLRLELEYYPQKDICIIHLGRQNNRNVLIIWGYGWQGTYAGTLLMANPSFWNIYLNYHMLLIEWTDANLDGLVQLSEIAVKCAGYGPHII